MRFFVITPPDEPAVSLEEMKEHLNIDDGDHDTRIEQLTSAAQAGFESPEMGILGRPVMAQQIEMEADCHDRLPLRLFGPITGSVVVVYRNSAGADVTVDTATYRIERSETFSPRLVGLGGWPYGNAVRIRCIAGLPADDPRLGNFKSAIMLHVQTIYDGVEDLDRYRSTIDSLLSTYRVFNI